MADRDSDSSHYPDLPAGLDFTDQGNYLEFVRKWFSYATVFLTIFTLFWDGFLVFWYVSAVGEGDVFAMVFPFFHLLIGLFLSYFVVASWINKTRILVSKDKIAIRHEPIPWFGKKEVLTADIIQLYTKEKLNKSKNGVRKSYGLYLVSTTGKKEKIFTSFESVSQVQFIEQRIEKYLNIKNMPVADEFQKK